MASIMISALRASLVAWLLCGILYPLAVTGLARKLFPTQANGSLVTGPDGTIRGSLLIGQHWDGLQWFHGRPSATTDADPADPSKTVPAPYNAAASSGSNYGPTSRALADRLAGDRKALEDAQPELAGIALPSDMLTASASGLDPDISPANAMMQVARVARSRNLAEKQVLALVQTQMKGRELGLFGEPRVNVLALNLALDGLFGSR